jgi:hypothetical protein
MEVADICCQGRVISVLEGGYGSYSNAAASKGHQPEHLYRSIFLHFPTVLGPEQPDPHPKNGQRWSTDEEIEKLVQQKKKQPN